MLTCGFSTTSLYLCPKIKSKMALWQFKKKKSWLLTVLMFSAFMEHAASNIISSPLHPWPCFYYTLTQDLWNHNFESAHSTHWPGHHGWIYSSATGEKVAAPCSATFTQNSCIKKSRSHCLVLKSAIAKDSVTWDELILTFIAGQPFIPHCRWRWKCEFISPLSRSVLTSAAVVLQCHDNYNVGHVRGEW